MPVVRQPESATKHRGVPYAQDSIENLHELVAIHLQRTDLRYTAGRQAIWAPDEYLRHLGGHPRRPEEFCLPPPL
jgi:hypothetical protein